MKLRFAGLVVIAIFAAWFSSGCERAFADEAKVRTIVERSSSAWRRVNSLQCDYAAVRSDENTVPTPASRCVGAYRLFIQGKQFRKEWYDNVTAPAGVANRVQGYNGEKLFNYLPSRSLVEMGTFTEMEVTAPRPLEDSFHWTVDGGGRWCWPEFRSAATWEAAAKRGRYIGLVKDGDAELEVIEFDHVKIEKLVDRVYFDPKHEMFPIKTESSYRGQLAITVTVDRHVTKKLGEQTLIVPVEVTKRELAGGAPTANVRTVMTLDAEALRLNPKLDDKLFEIPLEGIRQIQDVDQR
jgi:hypothetical protein